MQITTSEILSIGGAIVAAICSYVIYTFQQLNNKVSKQDFDSYTKDHSVAHQELSMVIRTNQDNITKNLLRISEQLGEIKGHLNKE